MSRSTSIKIGMRAADAPSPVGAGVGLPERVGAPVLRNARHPETILPVEGSYSQRQGRRPSITTQALIELVLSKLAAFERAGYLEEAFRPHRDTNGDARGPRIPEPSQWLVTEIARPGLWSALADVEQLVASGKFPDWDEDTLLDVVELFHNQVVSAPRTDADGRPTGGFDRDAAKRQYRTAMNEALALREPPLELRSDGRIVGEAQATAARSGARYDVYVSHASEDRDAIARPLARELRERGYKVFFDDYTLAAGDQLGAKIDEGLANARRGVVILSPSFFAKDWPRYELDKLLERESTTGETVLLPIWHGVDVEQVTRFSPVLADRLALTSNAGIDALALGIERALQRRAASRPNPAGGAGLNRPPARRSVFRAAADWLQKEDRTRLDRIVVAVIAGLSLIVIAAVAPMIVGALRGLFDSESSSSEPRRSKLDDFRAGGVQSTPGSGPPRRTFGCRLPTACEGPLYVALNSYFNNPRAGDERRFLALASPGGGPVVDRLHLGRTSQTLTVRTFVDNNTYPHVDGRVTDALDTRLRLALPDEPVYESNPTAYLYASNTRPQIIWDTVSVSSQRPVRLSYVKGSTTLTKRRSRGRVATTPLPDGVDAQDGLRLGRWKADFVNSGYINFKVQARALNEPVQDPRATRGIGSRVVYRPPSTEGLHREPAREGLAGDRYPCSLTSCDGPPFPALNAYQGHPLLGDEADFVRGALSSDYGDLGVEHYRSVIVVRPGDQLIVRVTVDNGGDPEAIGAPPAEQLVARDIRAKVTVPSGANRHGWISAELSSRNTQPSVVADGLPIRSREPIRLRVRPETIAILTDRGLKVPWPRDGIGSSRFTRREWSIRIGDVEPSFSKVRYLQFYVRVGSGS